MADMIEYLSYEYEDNPRLTHDIAQGDHDYGTDNSDYLIYLSFRCKENEMNSSNSIYLSGELIEGYVYDELYQRDKSSNAKKLVNNTIDTFDELMESILDKGDIVKEYPYKLYESGKPVTTYSVKVNNNVYLLIGDVRNAPRRTFKSDYILVYDNDDWYEIQKFINKM